MSKFTRGAKAFMRGFKNEPKKYNLQEIELEIENIKRSIESTKVNHVLHLLLCLPTAGIWVIFWIIIAISAKSERKNHARRLEDFYQMKGRILKKREEKKVSEQIDKFQDMDNTEKLIKLSDMLEKNLITKEEFLSQKEKLLV